MTDQRPCVCSDSCRGERFGPGCTSEPAPHGGYRPPYLEARQPVRMYRSPGLGPPRPWALRPVAEKFRGCREYRDEAVPFDPEDYPSLSHRDCGDEDDGRGAP